MAGIGFELKKLFNKEGLLQNMKAYSFSAVVTVGPAIIAMSTIFILQWLLKIQGIYLAERQVITSAIVYAFVFSQIITSGFTMVMTRYVADQIFKKAYENIMPSLYGIILICLPITAVVAGVFYFKSPLAFSFKLLAYTFTLEMTIIWILTIYLSALKDYRKIIIAYLLGFFVTVGIFGVCLILKVKDMALVTMGSMNIGFLILLLCLLLNIVRFMGKQKEGAKVFGFLSYFEKYPGLFFCNLFYTLGLYLHNFIYWRSSQGMVVRETYYIAPTYDTPAFFAFMAMLPTMVYFVVRTETSFYDHYDNYYSLILHGGTYNEVEHAKKAMIETLWEELRNIAEVQILVMIGFALAGYMLLSQFGASQMLLQTFLMLLLGSFSCSMMYIIILLLLYYDNRKDAALIAFCFVVGVGLFTLFGMNYKYSYHGFGFFLGATLALYVAFFRMHKYTKELDYHTFCAKPIIVKERKGIFTWLGEKLI
nr:exopolysaccharide Pel transporter PelG [uncultured Cellulosilyticum sp.]